MRKERATYRVYTFFRGMKDPSFVSEETSIAAAKASGMSRVASGARSKWREQVSRWADGTVTHEWYLEDDAVVILKVAAGLNDPWANWIRERETAGRAGGAAKSCPCSHHRSRR